MEDPGVLADGGPPGNDNVGADPTAGADPDLWADDAERTDFRDCRY